MQENLSPDEYYASLLIETNSNIPDDRSPLLRTSSYKEAVVNCDRGFFPRIPLENVRAGLQANVRLFVTNSCYVFFSQTGPELLQKQVITIREIIVSIHTEPRENINF